MLLEFEKKYRIVEKLGKGGFSNVYKVEEKSSGKVYCAKIPLKLDSPEDDEVFYVVCLREAKFLAYLLNHFGDEAPSILRRYGIPVMKDFIFDEKNEKLVIIIDYFGPSMSDIFLCNCFHGMLNKKEYREKPKKGKIRYRSIPEHDVYVLAYQLLETLEVLHRCGIVHNDIGLANIMLDCLMFKKVYLIDFGISMRFKELNCELIPKHKVDVVFGNPETASLANHLGESVSPKDDLESMFYECVFLMNTTHIFKGFKRKWRMRKKKLIRQKKEASFLTNPRIYIPKPFRKFWEYIRGMKYGELADYEYLRSLMKTENNLSFSWENWAKLKEDFYHKDEPRNVDDLSFPLLNIYAEHGLFCNTIEQFFQQMAYPSCCDKKIAVVVKTGIVSSFLVDIFLWNSVRELKEKISEKCFIDWEMNILSNSKGEVLNYGILNDYDIQKVFIVSSLSSRRGKGVMARASHAQYSKGVEKNRFSLCKELFQTSKQGTDNGKKDGIVVTLVFDDGVSQNVKKEIFLLKGEKFSPGFVGKVPGGLRFCSESPFKRIMEEKKNRELFLNSFFKWSNFTEKRKKKEIKAALEFFNKKFPPAMIIEFVVLNERILDRVWLLNFYSFYIRMIVEKASFNFLLVEDQKSKGKYILTPRFLHGVLTLAHKYGCLKELFKVVGDAKSVRIRLSQFIYRFYLSRLSGHRDVLSFLTVKEKEEKFYSELIMTSYKGAIEKKLIQFSVQIDGDVTQDLMKSFLEYNEEGEGDEEMIYYFSRKEKIFKMVGMCFVPKGRTFANSFIMKLLEKKIGIKFIDYQTKKVQSPEILFAAEIPNLPMGNFKKKKIWLFSSKKCTKGLGDLFTYLEIHANRLNSNEINSFDRLSLTFQRRRLLENEMDQMKVELKYFRRENKKRIQRDGMFIFLEEHKLEQFYDEFKKNVPFRVFPKLIEDQEELERLLPGKYVRTEFVTAVKKGIKEGIFKDNYYEDKQKLEKTKQMELRKSIKRDKWELDKDQIVKRNKVLGKGSNGAVYGGTLQVGINKLKVAIKEVFSEKKVVSEKDRDKVKREIMVMAKLHHVNVIGCFGGYYEGKRLFIVMEFAGKGDLFKFMKNPLGERTKLRIIFGIAEGMNYLHKKGFVHRDLKPQNVLIGPDITPKICDFGTTKLLSDVGETFCGTPSYVSPEMYKTVKGHKPELFDIYSFGIIIWEVWAGKEVYPNVKNPFELLGSIHAKKLRPNLDEVKDMPSDLREIMVSCWNEKATKRPQSFGAILEGLDCLRDSLKKNNI